MPLLLSMAYCLHRHSIRKGEINVSETEVVVRLDHGHHKIYVFIPIINEALHEFAVHRRLVEFFDPADIFYSQIKERSL